MLACACGGILEFLAICGAMGFVGLVTTLGEIYNRWRRKKKVKCQRQDCCCKAEEETSD